MALNSKTTEDQIQRGVARALDSMGLLWTHPANERKGNTARMVAAARGVKSGVPDVLIFTPTRTGKAGLAIELKTQRGKLSEAQKSWLVLLEQCGWATGVCRSVGAALDLIREHYQ